MELLNAVYTMTPFLKIDLCWPKSLQWLLCNLMGIFFFSFHRWKRQSAEEDIYKMDKSASDEGKNIIACFFPCFFLMSNLANRFPPAWTVEKHFTFSPSLPTFLPQISKACYSSLSMTFGVLPHQLSSVESGLWITRCHVSSVCGIYTFYRQTSSSMSCLIRLCENESLPEIHLGC